MVCGRYIIVNTALKVTGGGDIAESSAKFLVSIYLTLFEI